MKIDEQRRLIPIKVYYLDNIWHMVPADDVNNVISVQGDKDQFAIFLRKIKAKDSKSQPKSKRQITYGQMVSDIVMNTDSTIWVWSNTWMKYISKKKYIIL